MPVGCAELDGSFVVFGEIREGKRRLRKITRILLKKQISRPWKIQVGSLLRDLFSEIWIL
jgi:hypothetical protein